MADRQLIIQAIRNADAAGDSASVRKLGAFLASMTASPAAAEPAPNPTEGMSGLDLVRAGAGKAVADVGRGVGQLVRKVVPDKLADAVGLPTQADIDEAKQRDAALLATTGGAAGNIAGNVALALPAAFVPGAQGVAGAAATGAVMGLTQPVASDESRLKNTAVGAGAGAGGVLLGRGLNATAKGVKALWEPFTEAGRTKIAGRTLERFGVRAQDVAGASSKPTVTGAVPTMAEQIADPAAATGAARLQDAVRALDPEIAGQFAARETQNNAARVNTLADLAGQGGQRDFFDAARKAAGKENYGKAFAKNAGVAEQASSIDDLLHISHGLKGDKIPFGDSSVDVGELAAFAAENQGWAGKELAQLPREYQRWFNVDKGPMAYLSAGERGEMTKLLQMPAIKSSMKDAQTIAANNGVKLTGKVDGSIEGLHTMKLALDDAIERTGKGGSAASANESRSIQAARDRLVTFIEKMSPEYGSARAEYAGMSKPLNQMDIAQTLLNKGTSATTDLAGNARLMPNQLANAARDEGRLIQQATGRSGVGNQLSDILDPAQLNKIRAVLSESDRAAAVGRAANGPGSATTQRLASQNILRQTLGPTGLPESWAESTLLNTAMRPVQFAYNGVAEPKIQAVLSDLILNPEKAAAALQAARVNPRQLPAELQAALPYLEQALRTSAPAAFLAGDR